jgi:hypothetical protein
MYTEVWIVKYSYHRSQSSVTLRKEGMIRKWVKGFKLN